jgi:hypothetical protein
MLLGALKTLSSIYNTWLLVFFIYYKHLLTGVLTTLVDKSGRQTNPENRI